MTTPRGTHATEYFLHVKATLQNVKAPRKKQTEDDHYTRLREEGNRSSETVWSVHVKKKKIATNELIITYKIIARRGLSSDFFSSAVSKGICRGTTLQSMEGFILSALSWTKPGTVPAAKEPRVLITPTKPDTVSAWPTQDLAAPMMRGFSGPWEDWKTSLIPSISMRSPREVPLYEYQ